MADSNQLLEDLVDHFRRLSMSEYPHADLRNDVKTSAPGKQARPNGLLRRPLINRRSQLIIVAAGLAVACGLLWMWRPNSNSETLVFGQVKEAIQAIRSVSYTVTTTGWENDPWPDPYITNVMALEPGRVRVERDRELQIINPQENRFILIRHKERKVAIYPLYPRSDAAELPLDDFTQQLRNIPSIAVRKTGVRDVNGRKVVQFLWDNDGDYLIDVDAATMLPVRMEVIRGKASNNSEIREVISNFIFDAEVDESLFRATIPDGYICRETRLRQIAKYVP